MEGVAIGKRFSPERMREARLAADMSQADLARAIGKAEINVGRWERGEHVPRGESVVVIAQATGQKVDFFYVEAGSDHTNEALRKKARELVSPFQSGDGRRAARRVSGARRGKAGG